MTTPKIQVQRNDYGAIVAPADVLAAGRALVALAISTGKLDREHCSFDRKRRGSALNYDIYDVRGGTALVQRRYTEGDKYGLHPTKSYFLIRRQGKGVVVKGAPKATARKLAQNAPELGAAVDALEGKRKLAIKSNRPTTRLGYKVVEQRADGTFASTYDGSTWRLGKTRREAATPSHKGGYYHYESVEACRTAALERNRHMRDALADGRTLVILECEIGGREYRHEDVEIVRTPEPGAVPHEWDYAEDTYGRCDYSAGMVPVLWAFRYPDKLCSTSIKPLRVVEVLAAPAVALAA
jgi:hypothetical protein